jgi:hypothetical protein
VSFTIWTQKLKDHGENVSHRIESFMNDITSFPIWSQKLKDRADKLAGCTESFKDSIEKLNV